MPHPRRAGYPAPLRVPDAVHLSTPEDILPRSDTENHPEAGAHGGRVRPHAGRVNPTTNLVTATLDRVTAPINRAAAMLAPAS
jgi:hypothetical protein